MGSGREVEYWNWIGNELELEYGNEWGSEWEVWYGNWDLFDFSVIANDLHCVYALYTVGVFTQFGYIHPIIIHKRIKLTS